jgi:hypothetical protein
VKSIGEKIIDAIIAGKLVSCECANCEGSSCVLTWSANVHDQISQIVSDYQTQAQTKQSQPYKVLCKFHGALVIAEVAVRKSGSPGACPQCGKTEFTESAGWTSCECGFAYLSSGLQRVVEEFKRNNNE